jgi:hypothetical protein
MSHRKRVLLWGGELIVLAVVGLAIMLPLTSPPAHRINKDGIAQLKRGMSWQDVVRTLGVPPGDYRRRNKDEYRLVLAQVKNSNTSLHMLSGPLEEWVSDSFLVHVTFDRGKVGYVRDIAIEAPRDTGIFAYLLRWLGL